MNPIRTLGFSIVAWMPSQFACGTTPQAEPLKICTLIGCHSGVFFRIVGLPVELPDGTYGVEASINGRSVGCEIVLRQSAARYPSCTSNTGAPWVTLELDPSLRHIAVQGTAPRHVRVKLFVDGVEQSDMTVEPRGYLVFEPNGPQCSPTCLVIGPYELHVGSGRR